MKGGRRSNANRRQTQRGRGRQNNPNEPTTPETEAEGAIPYQPRLTSIGGAIARPAETMVVVENMDYLPTPGTWYSQNNNQWGLTTRRIDVDMALSDLTTPKKEFLYALPSLVAARSHYVSDLVIPKFCTAEFGLIMHMTVRERQNYLGRCGFDQNALGKEKLYDFGKLWDWLLSNKNVYDYYFDSQVESYYLDRILLTDEIFDNSATNFVTIRRCRNLGGVLAALKLTQTHGWGIYTYLWHFLTLDNDRRNRVIKNFRKSYDYGDLKNIKLLKENDVATVQELAVWLQDIIKRAKASVINNKRDVHQTIVPALSDMMQAEVESEKQRAFRKTRPRGEAVRLLTIDVLLISGNEVRSAIAEQAKLTLENIKCLKSGNEVAYLLSRTMNFSKHQITTHFKTFWNFKLPNSERNQFLQSQEYCPPGCSEKFHEISNVGELFEWVDEYDLLGMLTQAQADGIQSGENEPSQEEREAIKKLAADWNMVKEERRRWRILLGLEKEEPVSEPVAADAPKSKKQKKIEKELRKQQRAEMPEDPKPQPSTSKSKESQAPKLERQDKDQAELSSPAEPLVDPEPETKLEPEAAEDSEEEGSEEEGSDGEPETSVREYRPSGLVLNSGADCYMICVLQALSELPEFMMAPDCIRTVEECLTCHLRSIAKQLPDTDMIQSEELWKTKSHWKNRDLKNLQQGVEEDACLFFCALIDECYNNIDNIFTMSIFEIVKCSTCQNISSKSLNFATAMTLFVVETKAIEASEPHDASLSCLVDLYSEVQQQTKTCSLCGGNQALVQRRVEEPGTLFVIELHDPTPESAKKVYINDGLTVSGYKYCVYAVLVFKPRPFAHYLSYVNIQGTWWLMDGVNISKATRDEFYENSKLVRLAVYRRTGAESLSVSRASKKRKTQDEPNDPLAYTKLERGITQVPVFATIPEEDAYDNEANWHKYNDLGVVVVGNDVRVAPLLRAQISVDLLELVNPLAVLRNIISEKSCAGLPEAQQIETEDQIRNFEFISAITPQRYSGLPGTPEQIVAHHLNALSNTKGREFTLAQYESFLKVFNEIYIEYSSYNWPVRVVEICNRHPTMLTKFQSAHLSDAEQLIKILIADDIILKALKTFVLRKILELQSIQIFDLINIFNNFTSSTEEEAKKARQNLKDAARKVNRIRNKMVHQKRLHTFSEGQRRDFLNSYTTFVSNFNFKECFPLANALSMQADHLNTKVEYEFYTKILQTYSQLYAGYLLELSSLETTREEANTCMTELSTCYENVKQEKKYIDDQTYS